MTNTAIQQAAKPRGLAAMSVEQRRQIAAMGGRAAHQAGKAHRYTPEEARAAGIKSAALRAAKRAG